MKQDTIYREAIEKYEIQYRNRTPKSFNAIKEAQKYMPGGESRGSVWFNPYPFWCETADGFRSFGAFDHDAFAGTA